MPPGRTARSKASSGHGGKVGGNGHANGNVAAEKPSALSQPKKRDGRPPFVPTKEQRKLVAALASTGCPQEQIVLLITNPTTGSPIDRNTLAHHFRVELETSGPKANQNVAQSLYQKAMGSGPQSVTAAIWWTKCRMGWRERSVVEIETKSGVLVTPGLMTPEQWLGICAAMNARKTQPGEGQENGRQLV